MRRIAVCLLVLLAAAPPASADLDGALQRAQRFADARDGVVSFAVIDASGGLHATRPRRRWYSASLLKPILLGRYLGQRSVRHRDLTTGERRLLAPMIQASADGPANRLVVELGPAKVQAFGRRLGLGALRVVLPIWGSSTMTAAGYARFFRALPERIPERHRAYARHLLGHIVASQRWGIDRARPAGWRMLSKSGWRAGRGHGRIVNQAARLECGARVVTLVVLTDRNPSHAYATQTIAGVARRALRPFAPCRA